MKKISFTGAGLGMLLVCLGWFAVPNSSAVTFAITPSAISNQYAGLVTFQVSGLTNGEAVSVEKYLDANTNGVIDAGEFAVQRFTLVDGQASLIGGVTNLNVPGDADGPNGMITAQLNYQSASQVAPVVGKYLFRLSSPSGNWTPITNAFIVTNSAYTQSIAGSVTSSGTNIPNAMVIALTVSADGDSTLVAGTVADNAGHYSLGMPAGTYLLVAIHSNYVANVSGPVITLGAGSSISTNLGLIFATNFISGQMVDANNSSKGVSGIFIPVESADNLLAVIFTDANGNFSVPVTASSWKLQPSEQELMLHSYLVPSGKTKADTTAGNVTGVTIPVARANAMFYGTVKDDQNHPYPGVRFSVQDESSMYNNVHGSSDANGNCALALVAGTWELDLDGGNPALAGHVITQGTGSATLGAGQTFVDEFTVKSAPYHITGQVKGSNNQPIGGVGLVALDNANYEAFPVDTDSGGFYSLDVADGTWTVIVNCNHGNDGLNSLGYQCINNQTTNIAGANVVVDFVVPVPTSHLRGQVLDDLGHPITFMNIFAFATNQAGQYQATTDSGGNFDLGVAGGSYQVQLNTDPSSGIGTLGLVGPTLAVQVVDGIDINNLHLIARHVTGAIQVAVRNAGNNSSVAGIGATAMIVSNGTNYSTGNATTDNSGNVILRVFNGIWQVSLNTMDLANAGFAPAGFQNVTIAGNTNAITFLVNACGPPVITSISPLPDGSVETVYHAQFSASGCYGPPFVWSLAPASVGLPAGLSLSSDGMISGMPSNSGPFTFTMRVDDGHTHTDKAFTLQIGAALHITTATLPNGTQGTFYNFQIGALDGLPPYHWQLAPGSSALPAGLNLSTNGTLSGTPGTNGTFNFNVRVGDSVPFVVDRPFSLTIAGNGTGVTRPNLSATLPPNGGHFQLTISGMAGQNYTVQYSPNLGAWTTLLTTNSPVNTFTITDAGAVAQTRFYRVLVGP